MQRDPSEMNPAQLLRLRESFLELSTRSLGAAIGVDRRTVIRWEAGDPLSEANAQALRELVEYTNRCVDDLVASHAPGEPIITYRTDEDYRASKPDRVLTARWHRGAAERAADRVGGWIDFA